ncbi:tape measure protein [Agrilactobacillus fermenti]|uniref:tape measure protein n=1 Tax=Agrilactobacillus fermenti TaxID=2586909 RepID=UPI003A5C75F4
MVSISASIKIMDGFTAPLEKLSAGLQRSQSAFGKFKSMLGSGGDSLNGLSDAAGKTGGMFKSMLGANIIGAGVSRGVAAISSGLTGMVGELNEASTTWQTFNGNMSMLGKSPAQIAATRSDLQKFAQQTIYSASDMAQTYSQLAAVGIKGTGKLVKGFGGLASAAENPQQAMKTLSQQATQMAAKPAVQWQDFKLMLEQTPAGIAAVAKTMGMSTSDLVKSVQDGKVATQDFFNAVASTGTNANFTKLATQYKTVGQAMDGLKETMANSLQPAFDKVSQIGIKAISGITDKIGNVNFSGLADKLIAGLNTAKQAFSSFTSGFKSTGALTSVKTMFNDIGDAAKNIFKGLSGGGKDPFSGLSSLGKISGDAIQGLAKDIGAIAKAIGNLPPSTIQAVASAFAVLKAGTKGLVLGAIVVGLKALSKLPPDVLEGVAKGLVGIAIAFTMMKAVSGVAKSLSSIGSIFGKLGKGGKTKLPLPDAGKTSQSAAGLMKMGGALLMIGGAVLLAGAGFLLLAMGISQIASGGSTAVGILIGIGVAILVLLVVVRLLGPGLIAGAVGFLIFGAALLLIGIAVFIAAAGIAILAAQLPLIAAYGAQAALGLILLGAAMAIFGILAVVAAVGLIVLGVALVVLGVGFVVAAVGAILFGAALLIVGVGALIAAVGMLLLGAALMIVSVFALVGAVGMLLMAVALIMVAAVAIVAAVGMLLLGVALMIAAPMMILAAVGALLLGVAAIVLAVGLLLVGAALLLVAAGLTAAASGVIMLAMAFVMAGSMLVNAIVGAMQNVVSAVSNGISSAVNAAKSFGNHLVSVGKQLIQGLVNGIKSMIGAAVSAVKNVASKVVNAAKSLLHIGSPSKLFNQFGRWTVEGLANGINHSSDLAANASSDMAQGVIDAASGMALPSMDGGGLNMPTLNGNNPGDQLVAGFNRAQNAVNGIGAALNNLPANTGIGVNGSITDRSTPTSSPFGNGSVTNSHSQNSTSNTSNVNIDPGAIQINSTGNADYDAETLVAKIEDYLMQRQNASLS